MQNILSSSEDIHAIFLFSVFSFVVFYSVMTLGEIAIVPAFERVNIETDILELV